MSCHSSRLVTETHIECRLATTTLPLGILDLTTLAFEDRQGGAADIGSESVNKTSDIQLDLWPLHRSHVIQVVYQSAAMYLVSRNSIMPSCEPSRPWPDCLTPPKGAAGSDISPRLMATMPASMASATLIPRPNSPV